MVLEPMPILLCGEASEYSQVVAVVGVVMLKWMKTPAVTTRGALEDEGLSSRCVGDAVTRSKRYTRATMSQTIV